MIGPRWLLVGILVGGCGHTEETPDAHLVLPPGYPSTLTVAPSVATIALPFDASASGSVAAPLGDVSMAGDVGSVELGGASATAFVYAMSPLSGYTLYQGFAITPSRWDVFWLYCQGTSLAYIYDEGVDGPALADLGASGACQDTGSPTQAMVSLPGFSIAAPTALAGYTVSGSAINIADDGTGSITVGGHALPFVVFSDVDCSTTCGSPGWYELHGVLWDEAAQRAIFVIVYLETEDTTSVQLSYARSLPDLGDPIGNLVLPATWSATSASAAIVPRESTRRFLRAAQP